MRFEDTVLSKHTIVAQGRSNVDPHHLSANADLIADRRRLRRKLLIWRGFAFAAVVAALLGVGFAVGGSKFYGIGNPHIARFDIKGFISGDVATLKAIKKLKDDKHATAVLINIDSPGGTVTGSEAILNALKDLKAKKPTVAVVTGTAASGAYVVALGTERIIVRETSIVGSIGVLVQFPNVGKLLDTVGVKMEEVKSSPLKAAPNGFEPTSPEARAALQAIVVENYSWFKKLVKDSRSMSEEQLNVVSDGRVFSGRQGIELRLVDALGGEKEAIAWLEQEKGIQKELPVKDWKPEQENKSFDMWTVTEDLARFAGMDALANILGATSDHVKSGYTASGVLALWNPAAGFSKNP
jgi:protease IV